MASLDPAGRRDFLRDIVDRAMEGNTTVVFSTHIFSDLERVAMDIALLKNGHIALAGPLDELSDHMRRVEGPSDVLAAKHWGHELVRSEGRGARTTLIVVLDEADERRLETLAGNGVHVQPVALERRPWRMQSLLLIGVLILRLHFAVTVREVGLAPVLLILAALGCSGIVVALRYARLLDAPPAFPVGRLAAE